MRANIKHFILNCEMKQTIFDAENKCGSTFAGTKAYIFRIKISGHLRVVRIKQKARQRYTLNNLNDDRISFYKPIESTQISSALWASPLNKCPQPTSFKRCMMAVGKVLLLFKGNRTNRSMNDLFLRNRSDMTNDRQQTVESKYCHSQILGGLGVTYFFSRSLTSLSQAVRFTGIVQDLANFNNHK